ncbi:MAG: hypothetical protein ACHQ4H_10265 [Ktedonobacterales bacterium]
MAIGLLFVIVPWIIGFAWVLPDANRRGQPGLLWAVLTLPLGWIAVLVYLVARTLAAPRRPL